MPRNSESEVVRVLRAHRLSMNAAEDITMQLMAERWLEVERTLSANMSALANEMLRRAQAGEVITASMVHRAERYQILKAQMAAEIAKYNKDAQTIISGGQGEALRMGIDAAQDALFSSFPSGLSASFNKINLGAVDAMIGFAGDGSPLSKLLKNDYGDAANGMLDALISGVAQGQGAEAVARQMAEGLAIGLDRSLLIARTEINRSYRAGSTEQYRSSGVVIKFKRLVSRDEACLACIVLDGEEFDTADELSDHPNGRAELPDNLIFTDSPTALETFRHNDYVFIISTASGKELPVTANHPILTDRGWKAASFIKKGDNVISAGGRDWASGLMSPDNNNVPSFAKNLSSTFNMIRLGRVPTTAKHFYRNGEGGEIDVIFMNRLLWDGYNIAFKQKILKYFFGGGGIKTFLFNALGAVEKMTDSLKCAANSILSFFNDCVFFRLAHVDISQAVGLGKVAGLDAFTQQEFSYDLTGDIELYRDLVFSFPTIEHGDNSRPVNVAKNDFTRTVGGYFRPLDKITFGFIPEQPLGLEQVIDGLGRSMPTGSNFINTITSQIFLDSVINVERRFYSGHVYSLQNKSGWYVSNGIISHNCTAVPVIDGIDAPSWETGKEWLANQPESVQRSIMGTTRFDMWKDGMPLDNFATIKHSAEWGDSPQITPVSKLKG